MPQLLHAHHEPLAHHHAKHAPSKHEKHEHTMGHHDHHAMMIADFRRRFWVSLVLTLPILILSPMLQSLAGLQQALAFPGDRYLLFAFSSVVFVYGGWPFIKGLRDELGQHEPGMMTLIALAITVAWAYSSAVVFGLQGKVFFWELATLIDVMLLGHWIEMRSVLGASGALEALVKLLPTEAHRLKADGSTEEIAVTALTIGDRVLVKPGEKIPTDGVITEGESSLNEAMLTGESTPVHKRKGDEAIGGSVNGENSITLEIRKTGQETYLSQVIEMVRKAQGSRSRTQDLANRAAAWLTYIAISVGLITLFAWLSMGADFAFSLERMVTVMVITCPHALGLAVPLVVAVSTSMGAEKGLLIRNRSAFERARELDAVVFDKTGTLTEGRFGIKQIKSFGELEEKQVLQLAASLESQSEHPIAQGITLEAKAKGVGLLPVSGFHNLTGRGAEAKVNGETVKVVSPGYAEENGVALERREIDALAKGGNTVVVVLKAQQAVGAIALADVIRESSRQAIEQLQGMGIRCLMLTGDSEVVAKSVADELGLDDYFAGVLPEQKAEKIKQARQKGLRVAMVGDGVNDAPALVEADLGIAIGAGTDVAIESADVVLVKSDPQRVAAIIALSRATYRKLVQNLLWATGYNVLAIPLAAGAAISVGIVLSPAVGAALMSLSTVIVAINARLLKHASIT